MKLLKACASLAALAAVLVGVPWLLALWTDPASMLGVDWGQVLVRPDDGRILLEILGLLGWFAWIVLAVTTLLEVAQVVSRGTISPRLPGMGWLQPSVRVAVATALAPFMGLGVGSVAGEAVPPPAAAAPLPPKPAPPDQEPGPDEVEQQPGKNAHAVRHYEVQPGDELWGIAEQELGSGLRWREIIALNPGLTADQHVLPGTHLALPA